MATTPAFAIADPVLWSGWTAWAPPQLSPKLLAIGASAQPFVSRIAHDGTTIAIAELVSTQGILYILPGFSVLTFTNVNAAQAVANDAAAQVGGWV